MTASKYFNDHWTLDDGFGMGKAGDVLARMALEVDPPFSIRVTGKWGSGKTSVLRRAFATLGGHAIQQAVPLGKNASETDPATWTAFHFKERFNEVSLKAAAHRLQSLSWPEDMPEIGRSSLAVWYSPWQHQNADNPVIPLLLEIQEQYSTALKMKKKANEYTRKAGLATLNLFGCLLNSAASKLTGVDGVTEAIQKGFQDTAPSLTDLSDGQRFHLLFEDAVKAALESLSKKNKKARLVIFIDDLDRCEEKQIVKLLESIKLYLESKYCVFVFGMDDTAVISAVCRCWEGRTDDDNREYLEKMFQATVSVPLPKPESLQKAISVQLKRHAFPASEESSEIIIKLLEPNPRKIKNFCNSLCASWALLNPQPEIENLPTKFILLHYLRTFHYPVWRLLERQPCAILFLHKIMMDAGDNETIPAPPGEEENPIFSEENNKGTQRILRKFFRRAFSHILPHDEKGLETDDQLHLDMSLGDAVSLFTARQDRKRSDEFFRHKFRITFSNSDCLDTFFLYLSEQA